MRYSASRRSFAAGLVLAFAFLIIAVTARLPRVAGAAYFEPPPVDQFCNASSITINSSGVASPYPSNLTVSGLVGTVTSMTVTLNSFSHAFPDDVDILLVAPGGQNAIIMSDVGGSSPATGVTLTLDDAAATSLPDAGPLVSGTFKPTNVNALETFPAPAPTPSGGSALSAFTGITPNGIWKLYVVDDSGGDAGSIGGGWCLNLTTAGVSDCVLTCPADISQGPDSGQCGATVTYSSPTFTGTCGPINCTPASGSFFPMGATTVNCAGNAGGACSFTVTITGTCPSGCNPTAIAINSSGASTPYPSPLAISGNTGIIGSVTVTLNNFGHAFPDDVDILLVGPGGQNAIIMSDVGGGIPTSAVTLTLDDAAAGNLPDTGPLVSGTFKPTNAGPGDAFPAPAPAPLGGSALSVFNGTDPNGEWRLYVADDSGGDGGSIAGGWCLNITTVPVTCLLTCPSDVTQANTPGLCGALVSYPAPTTTGVCGTPVCSPASGSFFPIGTSTVNCTASGGGNCSFTVTVTGTCPGGCNPTAITINSSGAASPYPGTLAISGVTGTVASLTVTLNNLSHNSPDDVDILLVGPGGQNAIIMSDVGGSTAATNLTLILTDATASSLPDSGPLVSGTFKPTNSGVGDTFPAPAPAPLGGSLLSVFNGTNPNGEWRLYVTDDSGGDAGSISGGWCLDITATPPPCSITCPANQTVSNTPGQCGAAVSYSAPTTTGSCGTVTCLPASGSFFAVGTTTVNCSTTAGPSCSFSVTVNDTEAPTCNLPANITQNNAPGQCSAVVSYTATASDNCPGASIVCNPPSGSTFPVGTTTVNCTASDASPNSPNTNCSFTVTIVDVQPPTIVCPANVSATAATGQTSAIVSYPPPSVSDNCPGATFVCVPASGSSFPVGSTTVTCTATDASLNQASCTFKVTVSGAFLVNADSFLRDGADNTNEGGNNLLRIQSSGHNRVIVRFSLAGVSTVGLQSATLVLTISDNSDNWGPTGRLVDAHRLLADWTEGNGHTVGDQPNFRGTGEGVTWNCAKDSNIANMNDDCLSQWNGGTFAAATAAPVLHFNEQIGPVSWNVTADVLAGASNGWVIKKQTEGKSGQVKYYSKEGAAVAGNPSLGPRLVLVYAP